jgi:hypothetical protein
MKLWIQKKNRYRENAFLPSLLLTAKNTEEPRRVTFSASIIDILMIKYIPDKNKSLA